jgi:hypothetical protein
MNDIVINGSPDSQTITMTIEHYLVTLTNTTNKTYQMQKEYDSGDESAARSIAAANGANKSGISTPFGGGFEFDPSTRGVFR